MAKPKLLAFFLIILALSLLAYFYPLIQEKFGITTKVVQNEPLKEPFVLIRVIDGDTLEVSSDINSDNTTSVRLLGINTPEKKKPFSKEAADFLKPFINGTIYLQQDKEDKDKYGRSLRYVFADEKGNRLLNQEILELGLANSYMLDDLKYKDVFLAAENQAKNLQIGIWTLSNETCSLLGCIKLRELNSTAEFFTIGNTCSFLCNLDGWFVKDSGRNTFKLGSLPPNEEKTYPSSKEVWNNDGDRFFMFDRNGYLVIFYEYS
jgi:endonuclease YncB( thermonuclease family)